MAKAKKKQIQSKKKTAIKKPGKKKILKKTKNKTESASKTVAGSFWDKIKKIEFHPLLLAIYPMLFLFGHNVGELYLVEMIPYLMVSLILVSGLYYLINMALKNTGKTAIILSPLVFVFLFYGKFYYLLQNINFNEQQIFTHFRLFVIMSALYAVFLIGALATEKKIKQTNKFLNMFAVILCVIVILQSGIGLVSNTIASINAYKTAAQKETPGINRELPDIYYIIVDGFGRSDILEELYNYDNSGFVNNLRKKGFIVPEKAITSYCQTHIVLASVFNHMYLDNVVANHDKNSANRMLYRNTIKNNTVIPYLKEKGYEYVFLPGSHSTEDLKTGADRILNPGGFNINNFGHMLIKTSMVNFFSSKEAVEYDVHRRRILYNYHMLQKLPKEKNGGRFILAYFVSPHPPFVFDKNGNFVRQKEGILWTDGDHIRYPKEEYISGYRGQVEYTGKMLLKTVNEILKQSEKPPVIVIHGDHGPGIKLVWKSAEQTYVKERFSVLNALYFPGVKSPEIPENISIINNFLLIKKYVFNEPVVLLENRSFFSRWYKPYVFTEVTDRLED